jgi:hypothetical protein
MTQIQQDHELKPKPGTFYTQRKEELTAARFLVVRYLAYQVYKKENGKEMMDYAETLADRELVIQAVLQYELWHKLIIPDYERPQTASRGDIAIVNARLQSLEAKTQELTRQLAMRPLPTKKNKRSTR